MVLRLIRRGMLIALMLLATAATAQSREAVIATAEVAVRAGPSERYYVTQKLRRGTRVEVVGERNGYLEIAPPLGSFSWVAKDDVEIRSPNLGVIVAERAMTRVGSALLPDRMDNRGTFLPRGTRVTIVGQGRMPAPGGTRVFLKIVPVGEVRYIPASAVADQRNDRPAVPRQPAGIPSNVSDPALLDLARRADQAYRQAPTTGDWEKARTLYQQLAKSDHQEVRLMALNRLEFIKRQIRSRPPAIPTPGDRVSARYQPPSSKSGYTYQKDSGTSRFRTPPAASANRPGQTRRSNAKKTQGTGTSFGRLARSYRTIDGLPTYLILDSQSKVRCYVTPSAGVHLERYVNHLVEVQGSPLVYRPEVRGLHMSVSKVKLLGR